MTEEVVERALSEFVDAVVEGDVAVQQASFMFMPAEVIAQALARYVVLVEKQRDNAAALFRARIDVREVRALRETVVRQKTKIDVQAGEIRQLIDEARGRKKAA